MQRSVSDVPGKQASRRPGLGILVALVVGSLVVFPLALLGRLLANYVDRTDNSPLYYETKHWWQASTLFAASASAIALGLLATGWFVFSSVRRSISIRRLGVALIVVVAAGVLLTVATRKLYFVGGKSPMNLRRPALSGVPRLGATLAASPGRWRPAGRLEFDYAWERCSRAICHVIDGAEGRRYRVRKRDLGKRLRVFVLATDDLFSMPAYSPATPIIRHHGTPGLDDDVRG
jgi:hypothetical protein